MSKKDSFQCPHCEQQHPIGTTYCPINGLPIEMAESTSFTASLFENLKISKVWLIVGAVVIGAVLCLAAFVTLSIISNRDNLPPTPTIVVILPSLETGGSTPAPTPIEVIVTPAPQEEATSNSSSWPACAGADYLSRLHVGDTAEVSNKPPLANRVRSDAGLEYEVVGSIEPGERSLILDGPRCANNWVWWKVRSIASGMEGWTAEGDSDNYWLVPIIP